MRRPVVLPHVLLSLVGAAFAMGCSTSSTPLALDAAGDSSMAFDSGAPADAARSLTDADNVHDGTAAETGAKGDTSLDAADAAPTDAGTVGLPPPVMPVISRGAPAYASSNAYGGDLPTYANDADYSRGFRSLGYPMWIAYDLSLVPAAQRGPVFVAWYNETFGYDNSSTSTTPASYNEPGDYIIEANAAPGGAVPAANDAGWAALATVSGNTVHSRSHLLSLVGYNWLRFRATAGSASNAAQNTDCEVKLDVHDAHLGIDAWAFVGDSITALSMGHAENGDTNFAEAVAAGASGHFPAYEAAGFPYLKAEGDGPTLIAKVLAVSPASFVGISFGTNDGAGSMATDLSFHDAYKTMVDAVLAAGKIPVIPTIPYANEPTHNANIGDPTDLSHPFLLNVQLVALKSEYRASGKLVLDGPDLWAFFKANPTLIKPNDVHPTAGAGTNAYRDQWSAQALKTAYH